MTKLDRAIKRDVEKARAFIIKASGNRPQLCRDIGVGVAWGNQFALGRFVDAGYSKIVKILEYIKQHK